MAMTISKTRTGSACVAPVKRTVGMNGDGDIEVLEASLLPTAICAELETTERGSSGCKYATKEDEGCT
jgi:hypothetical protein